MDEGADNESRQAAEHDTAEEIEETSFATGWGEQIEGCEQVEDCAGRHARKHHAESHKGGTESVVGGSTITAAEIEQIKHKGSEAEPITELFDTDGYVDGKETVRLHQCQPAVERTWQSQTQSHRPQPAAQTSGGYGKTACNAACKKGYDTDSTIDPTHLSSGESKTAGFAGSDKKDRYKFDTESLGQTVKQHKGKRSCDAGTPKEGNECIGKITDYSPCRYSGFGMIGGNRGHHT